MSGGWEWVGLVQTRRLGNSQRKAVLAFLANAADEHGGSMWGTERIAAATDIGLRKVRTILAGFTDAGLVCRERRRNHHGNLGTWQHWLQWDAIAALPWNGVHIRGIDGDPFAQVSTSGPPPTPGPCDRPGLGDDRVHPTSSQQGAPRPGAPRVPRSNPSEEPQKVTPENYLPPPVGDGVAQGQLLPVPASPAPAPRPRPRDPLWDALVAVVGASPATTSERGAWNAAAKQLREAAATPDQVHARAGEYRRRWPAVSLTPPALVKHWGALASVHYTPPDARPGPQTAASQTFGAFRRIAEESQPEHAALPGGTP